MESGDELAKKMGGEIALSEDPGVSMRKWREIFGIKQNRLAEKLGISTSVISDYESGRRRSPGVGFVRRFIGALIQEDIKSSGGITKKFSQGKKVGAILDMREFLTPVPIKKVVKAINGKVIVRGEMSEGVLWGYTVVDSVKAILELSETEFMSIYGSNTERALIFIKVHLGRSPMIAIRVTPPKPSLVVLHGLKPENVDRLAVKIAKLENIPLVVSKIGSEEELIDKMERFT